MAPGVAIAVSGGIDSMTAAWLLKSQGLSPVGIHFTTGYETARGSAEAAGRVIGRRLGIEVTTVDIAAAFQERVVDRFTDTYALGRTPNPCMVCNHRIKFGLILDTARRLGADRLATGHYARCVPHARGGFRLLRGVDPEKDQSYFLARLAPEQLARAFFPLGHLTKARVRDLARRQGLVPVFSAESQDVCFIPRGGHRTFLAGQAGIEAEPGDIVDTAGEVIGRHRGLAFYTIGQRRGLNCPAGQPYYVVRIEPERNRLVVGFRSELAASGCRVVGVRWLRGAPPEPAAVNVQIRYRSPARKAQLIPEAGETATVQFAQPAEAVAPGQGAVFYRGDEVLGSGWIEAALPPAS